MSVRKDCQCHHMPEPTGCGVFGALVGQVGDVFREICHGILCHPAVHSDFGLCGVGIDPTHGAVRCRMLASGRIGGADLVRCNSLCSLTPYGERAVAWAAHGNGVGRQ
jgi:hypothetical protein